MLIDEKTRLRRADVLLKNLHADRHNEQFYASVKRFVDSIELSDEAYIEYGERTNILKRITQNFNVDGVRLSFAYAAMIETLQVSWRVMELPITEIAEDLASVNATKKQVEDAFILLSSEFETKTYDGVAYLLSLNPYACSK